MDQHADRARRRRARARAAATSPAPRPARSFDALGAITVTAGLTVLVYASSRTSSRSLGLAAVLLAAFVVIERRTANPLVPFAIFSERSLTGAPSPASLMGGALIGLFFFATLYLQQVLGYGPLTAGAAFLPLALTIGASAGIASKLPTKRGPQPVLIAGPARSRPPACTGSRTSCADGSYLADVLFPTLVVALGMGLAFVPLTIAAHERRARGRVRPGQRRDGHGAADRPGRRPARCSPGWRSRTRSWPPARWRSPPRSSPSDQRDRAHRGARPAAELQG